MWDSAPWTPKEWTSPRERIRLVQSRIICNDDPILDPANPKRSCRITIRYIWALFRYIWALLSST